MYILFSNNYLLNSSYIFVTCLCLLLYVLHYNAIFLLRVVVFIFIFLLKDFDQFCLNGSDLNMEQCELYLRLATKLYFRLCYKGGSKLFVLFKQ